MRICYFGAFDLWYARNNFIRQALESSGCRVSICNVPQAWPTYRKTVPLIMQYRRVWRDCDLILVAEFCQTLVPLAWLLGRLTGRPVVFDMVIGLYEASVIERRRHARNEFAARKLFYLDKAATHLANAILTGTTAYKEYVAADFGIPAEKIHLTPLGVNDHLFRPGLEPSSSGGKLTVLYHGSFIPNHGVDIIINAAAAAGNESAMSFRFIGDGEGKAQAMELAERLRISNITFVSKVPFESLPAHIAEADIVLGVFGDTPQAKKAMANKVLEGLAMRKSVITGDTLSTRENFVHREHLWMTPLGDPVALAHGLQSLAADEKLRARLAERGHRRVIERLTPAVVGKRLKAELQILSDRWQK
ncbi:MAG TPA: glycosyltransferase [Anaerolineales bacterium]|jgi:glycosyltransferase involved in cell wall biosynthesis|nr:glycosyltransferase [Anaerolineales bacterium]